MAGKTVLKVVAGLALMTALSACGGGGGSTPSNPNSPSTPNPPSGTYTTAGNAATVEGVDSAHRGYRDDVYQLIQDKYSATPAIAQGAALVAKSYQASITTDVQALADTTPNIITDVQTGACAVVDAGKANGQQMIAAMGVVYARTFNTDARLAARKHYVSSGINVGAVKIDYSKCAANGGTL